MRKSLAILTAALLIGASPVLADPLGSAVGGQAGNQSYMSGGVYNSSAPTLTTGQQAGIQLDASGNLKTVSSGTPSGTQTVGPVKVIGSDISGTVTAGGTYQQVAAASLSRNNCTIQNPTTATEALLVKLGTMSSPFTLAPGQAISTLNGVVNDVDAITLTATTTAHAFAGLCQ